MTSTLDERIDAVRSFNRFYTAHVGALGDGYLQSPYALTQARVLFELARHEPTRAVTLGRLLDLDPSHLSRILARFEADGLLVKVKAADDGRGRALSLTAAGRSQYAELSARATGDIAAVLQGLGEPGQRRLIAAMSTIRQLVDTVAADRHPDARLTLRGLRPGDLGWVVHRNAVLYAEEYGFDHTYEGLVASIVGDYARRQGDDGHRAWVAELDGEAVGFVMCAAKDEQTAQLRLLLVEPHARGFGVGSRLVDECVGFARSAGYRRMILWTTHPLVAARRIYQRAGFRLVSEAEHHGFGQDLIGQTLELELD